MRTIILFVFCFCNVALALAQTVTLATNNLNSNKAIFSSLQGEVLTRIDSVMSDGQGKYVYQFNKQNTNGMYRISFSRNKGIDFILDGEDVEIKYEDDSVQVVQSKSNRLFHSFRKLNQQFKLKSEILQLVLSRYPNDEAYYQTTLATVEELQNNYSNFVYSATTTRPSSFVARYIRSAQLPVIDMSLPENKQIEYLKSYALAHVDFSDEELIFSDLFTTKSIEYLTLYRNPQFPKELLESEFNVAIDTLLNKAKVNQAVYQHITKFLIEGFKEFGFERNINYILDNYVIKDDLCLDEKAGSSVQRMIEQKKHLTIGSIAPEIKLPDTNGNIVSLQSIVSERTLIVFYSTSCPHCQTTLPRLVTEIKSNIIICAVSLDTNKNDWLRFIKQSGLTRCFNLNDSLGWNGQVAMDYYLYATPTMILLDKEKKILDLPLTVEDVLKNL
jgi:peroxiredoxin